MSSANRAVDKVVPRPWVPDPWLPARKGRVGWLRLLVCPLCGYPLARDAQVTAALPDDPPSRFHTAVRQELVLRGLGPNGLPRYGLPGDEAIGRRPRGSTRFEAVLPGPFVDTDAGRVWSPAPTRVRWESVRDQIPGLPEAVRGAEAAPGLSPAQQRRQRKRRQRETGVLEFPSAREATEWRKVQPQAFDGFPGLAGVFFVTAVERPCEVFCPNPSCGGWHRIPALLQSSSSAT